MEKSSRSLSLNHEIDIPNSISEHVEDNTDGFETSPDKDSLVYYERLKIVSFVFLCIGYVIFLVGLFYPIIVFSDGEFVDHSIFRPSSETILHSILTLYRQKAYFTLFSALIFSICCPCIKIILVIYVLIKSLIYKRLSLEIINSNNYDRIPEVKCIGKTCSKILNLLKFISKFQFLDSFVVLFTVSFTKNRFVLPSAGWGILSLMIYCLISIPATQAMDYAFVHESKILKLWVDKASNMNTTQISYISNRPMYVISVLFYCMIIVFSSSIFLSHEKMLFIGFTLDTKKEFIIYGRDFSYMDLLEVLSTDYLFLLSIFTLFGLAILVPLVNVTSLLFGLISYNVASSYLEQGSFYNRLCIKISYYLVCISRWLSEWSCGDVVAISFVAAQYGLTTTDLVVGRIPPTNSFAPYYILIVFGIASFAISILVYDDYVTEIIDLYHEYNFDLTEKPKDLVRNNTFPPSMSTQLNTIDKGMENQLNYSCSLTDKRSSNLEPSSPQPSIELNTPPRWKRRLHNTIAFLTNSFLLAMISIAIFKSYTQTFDPVEISVGKIQDFLTNNSPRLFKSLRNHLPVSFGTCAFKKEVAPTPCFEFGNIYTRKNILYLEIPWVSGVNTIQLTGTKAVLFTERRFDNLNVYSTAGSCLPFCTSLYTGYGLCCGNGVEVTVWVNAKCLGGQDGFSDIKVSSIHFANMHFGEVVEKLINKFVDVRELVDSMTLEKANELLKPENKIINLSDTHLSAIDLINFLVKLNAPGGIICPPLINAPGAQ